jgi:uncharacterized protein (UPF0264 family)
MTRLLVSVREPDEALAAATAGADFVDLKEPSAGALGALPPREIAAITALLRRHHRAVPVSATVGDWPSARRGAIVERVETVARCGVDYVKVGVEAGAAGAALLQALAQCGLPVVPVLLADRGIDPDVLAAALQAPAFPVLMLDTADKRGGGLFEKVAPDALRDFVVAVRASGRLAGVAGSLAFADLPALRALAPDIAGFRGAVCEGGREGVLEPGRVRALGRALHLSSSNTVIPAKTGVHATLAAGVDPGLRRDHGPGR